MEATRAALESERKLQLLQMQAINALWKKVIGHFHASSSLNVNFSSTYCIFICNWIHLAQDRDQW
jgi:hypothetical protein